YCSIPRFKQFLALMGMVRDLYDRLSVDELLFLIYITYPKYIKYSIKYKDLMRKKKSLAESLLRKGLITPKRYEEILRLQV
ncbi:MAG: hypothetical protein ACP6IS_11380, partial [Candidatus Asgardarchaeia archaeon]